MGGGFHPVLRKPLYETCLYKELCEMASKPTTHHPTKWRSAKPTSLSSLFEAAIKIPRIREYVHHELTTERSRFLTNGKALVWVSGDADGRISFTVDDDKNTRSIELAIRLAANSAIVKYDDPRCWGFETEEAWVNALKAKQRGAISVTR